jgi:hypothetical protein
MFLRKGGNVVKQIGKTVLGAAVILALSAVSSAPIDARKVRIDLSWTDAKPESVDLQGSDFGSKSFTLSGNQYSLEHMFPNVSKPARIIIVYENVSAVFPVRPYGIATVVPIRLTIKPGQYCDDAVIKRLEQNAQSGDYNRVMSSAIQSELVLATDTCDVKFANRLNNVRVDTRCNLAGILDFFDISGSGIAAIESRLKICKGKYAIALARSVKSDLDRAWKSGNISEAMEVYADISALLEDKDLAEGLAESPRELEGLKSLQSRFVVDQFIKNQSLGNFVRAGEFREQVLLLKGDPDYSKAFEQYSADNLQKILGMSDLTELSAEIIGEPETSALLESEAVEVVSSELDPG